MRHPIVQVYLSARSNGLIHIEPDNLWIYALADEEEIANLFHELETMDYIDNLSVVGGMLTARRTAKLGREAGVQHDTCI